VVATESFRVGVADERYLDAVVAGPRDGTPVALHHGTPDANADFWPPHAANVTPLSMPPIMVGLSRGLPGRRCVERRPGFASARGAQLTAAADDRRPTDPPRVTSIAPQMEDVHNCQHAVPSRTARERWLRELSAGPR
jgi:hypothetical protein